MNFPKHNYAYVATHRGFYRVRWFNDPIAGWSWFLERKRRFPWPFGWSVLDQRPVPWFPANTADPRMNWLDAQEMAIGYERGRRYMKA